MRLAGQLPGVNRVDLPGGAFSPDNAGARGLFTAVRRVCAASPCAAVERSGRGANVGALGPDRRSPRQASGPALFEKGAVGLGLPNRCKWGFPLRRPERCRAGNPGADPGPLGHGRCPHQSIGVSADPWVEPRDEPPPRPGQATRQTAASGAATDGCRLEPTENRSAPRPGRMAGADGTASGRHPPGATAAKHPPPMKFLLLFMLPALAAAGSSIRDVCLPPWYDQAAFQRVELELKDLPVNYVQLDHPCTIFCTNQVVMVSNGIARATLLIDLRKTPATFPIIVMRSEEHT